MHQFSFYKKMDYLGESAHNYKNGIKTRLCIWEPSTKSIDKSTQGSVATTDKGVYGPVFCFVPLDS